VKRAEPSELRAFLGAFSPEIALISLRLRSLVLEDAPLSTEFVDDAAGAVGMSYGFTDRAADAFCRIAVHSRWVNLEFPHGSQLPDPGGRLEGSGLGMRHLRMTGLDDLRRPFVGSFLRAAIRAAPRSAEAKKKEGA
jgi:hypothetical protein